MKKQVLLSLLSALLLAGVSVGCSAGPVNEVSGGEEIEGWRTLENGDDVFYMKIYGSASDRAEDQAQKRQTCIEATKLQANDTIIRKIIGEEIQAISGTVDAETTSAVITSFRKGIVKGVSVKECAKTAGDWEQCVCVHYVSGKGLKKQFKLEVQKAKEDAGV